MRHFILMIVLALPLCVSAQKTEAQLSEKTLYGHLRFLASDELAGRRTGDPGNDIAARYIAEQFRSMGLQAIPGSDDYLQKVPLDRFKPAETGLLTWGADSFLMYEQMLVFAGEPTDMEHEYVFAGHGWVDEKSGHNDYRDLDVEGKIVIALVGLPDSPSPRDAILSLGKKRQLAHERGAKALIEMYQLRFPWKFVSMRLRGENLRFPSPGSDASSNSLSHCWIDLGDQELSEYLKSAPDKLQLQHGGALNESARSFNVFGMIEGSDPNLKDEYVLLSAHFDHVGVGKQGGQPYTSEDSIFNGARDNAMGTTALLAAAEALSKNPPKRSVICLAVTGEEMGFLGSLYYCDHPLIPLNKTIVNLNTDGAGYHDTSIVTVVGHGRVGLEGIYEEGSEAFGLKVFPNPLPEMGLFDRSDNVAFAQKGIPAPSLSPGVTDMNEEVSTYYHQAADNPDKVNPRYLHKYCQAFAYTARLIADRKERPRWVEGDKYEAIGKELYGED